MKLLSGTDVASFVKERQVKQVRNLRQSWATIPRLAVVQTVDDPVIDTYVRLKRRYADDIGVEFEHHKIDQARAEEVITSLNERTDIHGIITQLPLADMTAVDKVVNMVAPNKDVDGLHDDSPFSPATPMAINWLLAAYDVGLEGKRISIIGRGRLVGEPLIKMWQQSGYHVTSYDENSGDISAKLRESDVIVSAAGSPQIVTSDMVRPGAVVVDAGTTAEKNSILGDVSDDVRERDDVSITPKKGGVGPLTVAALFENVLLAARNYAQSIKSREA